LTKAQTAIAAGTTRRIPAKRARIEDDVVADYLALLVKPGDKTLQLGGSDLGTVFLQRGAFHEVIASLAETDILQTQCERRSVKVDRLRRQAGLMAEPDRSPLDAALIGSDLGFPAMAGNWRQIAGRMKLGGVLVLMGAGRLVADGAPADVLTPENLRAAYGIEATVGTLGGHTAIIAERP